MTNPSDPSDTNRIPLLKTAAKVRTNEAWKHFSSVFDLSPLKMDDSTGIIDTETWIAGNTVFGQIALDSNRHDRHAGHIKSSGSLLLVHRYLHGGADGLSGNTPYMMRPGPVIYHDYSRPFEAIQTPTLLQGIYVLHESVDYDPLASPPQMSFQPGSTMGAYLRAEFDFFFGELVAGAESLEAARIAALKTKISHARTRNNSKRNQRRRQIAAFIEAHLGDHDLSPGRLQKEFEISRAELYRSFERYSGVLNYIEVRRLFRACLELSKKPSLRKNLRQVALKWGFSSEDEFRYALQLHYRARPEDLFTKRLEISDDGSQDETLSDFVDKVTGKFNPDS